jgi:hypothetical protein
MAKTSKKLGALGTPMALGTLELAPAAKRRSAVGASRDRYMVRLLTGERVAARLTSAMQPAFARQCLRDGRMVVLVETAEGAMVAGALQTEAHPSVNPRGGLTLEADHLRLSAKRSLVLEAPGGRLELEPGGAVRIEGDRLVLDAAALVRILSARVEVP